jgi:hypothetical protein
LGLRIVEEIITSRSPFASALQQAGDETDRVDFLDQRRELVADTVDRLSQPGATLLPSARTPMSGADS